MIDIGLFKQGMRRLAAGVSIVTTIDAGRPCGLVATSVTSVSIEPLPCLLVCINRSASSHDAIGRAGFFCVNLLSVANVDIAHRFSSSRHREHRFKHCEWVPLTTGAPALTDALASFDCRLSKSIAMQSHTIFIAEVVALKLWINMIKPLVYVDGHFESLRGNDLPIN